MIEVEMEKSAVFQQPAKAVKNRTTGFFFLTLILIEMLARADNCTMQTLVPIRRKLRN
jgi:hypothetical protein